MQQLHSFMGFWDCLAPQLLTWMLKGSYEEHVD
jgi:hypothetical protein